MFNFFHGLTYLPQKVQEYIENKDFIDIGAYIGDSAIALKDTIIKKYILLKYQEHRLKNTKET